jgi:CHAT domain-containing protein
LVEAPATTSDVQAVALADVTSALDGQKLQVQKLSGRDATHSAVVSGMRDAQYVLFSTHGRWFNGGGGTIDEAFGSAGIQLWNDAVAPDSVLTAADIVTIDLSKSDLVVLLACETAQGQAVSGQGSLGFQSAFMAAGARSLLVALWRVPADASKDLVQNFYSGLFNRHLSRSEALKQAQDTLRNQPRFADPWNWAGWVLVGDPAPMTQ